MTFTLVDAVIFAAFYACVLTLSLVKSRGRKDAAGFFLGGRSLPWWLIGISIVAANISTEQFVGMAGQAAGDVGLAVSAWQLTGIVGIVIVAFTFLPRFLRAGIYTMPEYLEYRYSPAARALMSVLTVAVYVLVTTAAVLYSGATTLSTVFGVRLDVAVVLIAALAVLYTTWGGLLAAVWADLLQGTALLVGGLLTLALGLHAVGGVGPFLAANARPAPHGAAAHASRAALDGARRRHLDPDLLLLRAEPVHRAARARRASRCARRSSGSSSPRRCGCWSRSASSCRGWWRASSTARRSRRPTRRIPRSCGSWCPPGCAGSSSRRSPER